jgi:hypothetical protein
MSSTLSLYAWPLKESAAIGMVSPEFPWVTASEMVGSLDALAGHPGMLMLGTHRNSADAPAACAQNTAATAAARAIPRRILQNVDSFGGSVEDFLRPGGQRPSPEHQTRWPNGTSTRSLHLKRNLPRGTWLVVSRAFATTGLSETSFSTRDHNRAVVHGQMTAAQRDNGRVSRRHCHLDSGSHSQRGTRRAGNVDCHAKHAPRLIPRTSHLASVSHLTQPPAYFRATIREWRASEWRP